MDVKTVKMMIGSLTLCLGTVGASLEIGGVYSHVNLKVHGQPSFHGNLGGIQGHYAYNPWEGFYAELKGSWQTGNTRNRFTHRDLTYIDAEERIGYSFSPFCHDLSLTFFSGFGYHYLRHKLKEHSIKFQYNEFYVPVGFLSEYFLFPCWSLGINFNWMPQVYPTVEITPLKGARWTLTNSINNFIVELPLTYSFHCYSLILKPFYEQWNDGKTTARSSCGQRLGLPKNSYHFWGGELNFSLSF